MPRLYRPHIPLDVQARVLIRQRGYLFPDKEIVGARLEGLRAFVDRQKRMLAAFLHCDVRDLRLDHDPALGTRMKRSHFNGKKWISFYSPDANDPDHLIYREKHAHHIKTNVRGEHGQHPDRVLIKKERRRLREGKRRFKRKITGPANAWLPGRKLQSRGFQRRPKQ
jgi:hypothetical protein